MTLPSRDDALTWIGLPVHDSAGAPCGSCRNVFADRDSGLPEWVEVQLASGDAVLAPTLGARLDDGPDGGVVHLAHALDVLDRAPRFPSDVDRTPDEEKRLYEHYGVPWSDARSGTLLPAAVDAGGTAPQPVAAAEPVRTAAPSAAAAPVAEPAAVSPAVAADQVGRPRAALVAGPAAAALAAAGLLLRRRRQQPQPQAGLGLAVLLAPLALLVAVLGRRRRRARGARVEVGEVQPMPTLVDHRGPEQPDAPY